ncbi:MULTISPECIES: xanthine dehydrogenase molybdopterin binding subunit [Mesorhizobium]|uniref:xanthine dehydrogenase molybdopterin binding subunit n=15 Tax=Phyllobacteriaceae TaxID=69277 RepID=UPI000FCADA62|nr:MULTISPECIES: xanthine dehydrogenase molybdopterin binding subunit [Mesorhizobium]MCF6124897.1 xanthine dehydrogenase molybdopterin binding subunit [Mesorhizobium ciceri]MCQ8814013.1 xanthine dehydrogenase molybdopterin binding subunit [Mesorhizobium sp. SEMIA396]RUX79924.1 xanthine dehydrogenase molybdopterin binding subunit [Mesorhizobium sp. M7A.F.Ca.CA.004.08.2.1]RUX85405.1 xanthine dehydrogenase molybdopterin binding subunit [Mesorhizobium sp. M7A.F.Ca.CA.004.08.1.1]RUY58341.1 xanthine
MNKHAAPNLKAEKIAGGVATDQRHDSAHKHVSGTAVYIDDMPEPAGTLHGCLGLSSATHATIASMDLSAVRTAPGVVDVLTASDVPGENDISPTGRHDEPVLADGKVQFYGQPIFCVIAQTREQARRATRLAKVEYKELPFVTDIGALDPRKDKLVTPPLTLKRGDAATAIRQAPRRLKGKMRVGGQEHFYLEGHIAMAIPGEDQDVTIYSSTQHPSEVQHMVSHALGVPSNAITVEIRRMGGGFGGKETQGNQFAALAAIAAKKHHRAVKIRPDRDDDMIATGKRHDFLVDYEVGFDDEGNILGVDFMFAARCGFSSDLSGPVTDRALFHCDNTYFWPAVHAQSAPLYTNTVSNTAFRGFGGPQGMVGAERVIDEVAFAVGKDPLEIRKKNFYGTSGDSERGRNITPYHQTVEDNIIQRIVAELEESASYARRRREISAFNANSRFIKRGLALTPVKFGISFTATHYNQAGALVHVYTDGSVHLNHGGTEMGQGLYVKVAQVVAEEFQIDLDQVKITATTTGKVPNTSATAASSGSDLNGMAAQNGARQIKDRLTDFAAEKYQVPRDQVLFLPNRVRIGNQEIAFADLVKQAYMARVQLSAAGFYKTPKIHWNRDKGEGRPFYYFAYGASCSEVSVDTLTGEYMVERTDILHDCGRSLNRAIDIGQIEGGFIQGMGWLTTEELWWDAKGRLRTHAPSTYKIPLASDRPKIFNVTLADWPEAGEPTIHRSKAVGEPPFPLGMSVLHALSDAVASVADNKICPRLDAPATPERVLMAIERLKKEAGA